MVGIGSDRWFPLGVMQLLRRAGCGFAPKAQWDWCAIGLTPRLAGDASCWLGASRCVSVPYTWSPHAMWAPHSTAAGSPNRVSREQAPRNSGRSGKTSCNSVLDSMWSLPLHLLVRKRVREPAQILGEGSTVEHEYWGGMLHWWSSLEISFRKRHPYLWGFGNDTSTTVSNHKITLWHFVIKIKVSANFRKCTSWQITTMYLFIQQSYLKKYFKI